MQQTSETYKALLQSGNARKEYKVVISGQGGTNAEDYFRDRICYLTTRGGIFAMDRPGIGGTVVREIDLKIWNPGTIPYGAELRPYVRLTDGETSSEWLQKGLFFIDTRDERPGVVIIHGYCSMLKGEQPFMQSGDQGVWPRRDRDIVAQAAQKMGVTVDPATTRIVTRGYSIGYPGYGQAGRTVQEVLGYIAAMYAGNFIMSDTGTLLLLKLQDLDNTAASLLINEDGQYITLGGVRICV
ncbi:MAG: hypothetical protein IJT94_00145 [Oscillibacter sp.]|nr:hypothetical protein [Oscillibacter sp.]